MHTSGIFPVLSTGTCATLSIHSCIALVMCGTTIRQKIVCNRPVLNYPTSQNELKRPKRIPKLAQYDPKNTKRPKRRPKLTQNKPKGP